MSPIMIGLEGLLALLLAACLFFCWRLERRLSALRSGNDGVIAAAAELAQATAQADAAVRSLRSAATETGRDLQTRINDARAISDRLGIGLGRVRSAADVGAGRVG
ncbi:MAG: DUF6468 domain-containing protein [Hyphomonadaceae bacterium]